MIAGTVPADGAVLFQATQAPGGTGFFEGYGGRLVVSEPATSALLAAGVAALAGLRRRQRKPA